MTTYNPGDEVTITIKGKIPKHYYGSTEVTIKAPQPAITPDNFFPLGAEYSMQYPKDVTISFGLCNTEIHIEHKATLKNGVYIDLDADDRGDKQYWMLRPDGWHRMYVGDSRATMPECVTRKPKNPQRLKEDR